MGLRLQGRRVVVVGGGSAAYRGVVGLLDVGARVAVVSPTVTPAVEALTAAGAVTWVRRRYVRGDLAEAWFALAATDDACVNGAVAAEAEQARVFCTVADAAELSSAFAADLGTCDPAGAADPMGLMNQDGVEGRHHTGGVVLVGGGPGDPDLVTVRGRQALSDADVVITDHLAPQSLLTSLRAGVEVVDAAKLPRGRSMAQEDINALLVSHARAGRRVVRLKGGDPFVFGRGMEEVQCCVAAGVPVEVVPGVSSAIGVPAVAGIPVTQRGLTHEFVVVSGHVPPGHPQSLVDWSAVARLKGTVIVLMGVQTAPAIAATLIQHGRPSGTPVAVVTDGTTRRQRTVRTTLEHLGRTIGDQRIRPPAVWVAGDVVRLAPSNPEAGRTEDATTA